jgi:ABC-type tungstate transport system substrate-binding protein
MRKMALRDVVVARGVVLLEPGTACLLGGKIEGCTRLGGE